jgi:hypothetical protein
MKTFDGLPREEDNLSTVDTTRTSASDEIRRRIKFLASTEAIPLAIKIIIAQTAQHEIDKHRNLKTAK